MKIIHYAVTASILVTAIYGELHIGEIRAKLKPTFTVMTPWGTLQILTPWGKQSALSENVTEQKETHPTIRLINELPQRLKSRQEQRGAAEWNSGQKHQDEIFKCEINGSKTYQNKPCGAP